MNTLVSGRKGVDSSYQSHYHVVENTQQRRLVHLGTSSTQSQTGFSLEKEKLNILSNSI